MQTHAGHTVYLAAPPAQEVEVNRWAPNSDPWAPNSEASPAEVLKGPVVESWHKVRAQFTLSLQPPQAASQCQHCGKHAVRGICTSAGDAGMPVDSGQPSHTSKAASKQPLRRRSLTGTGAWEGRRGRAEGGWPCRLADPGKTMESGSGYEARS